ncbi:MAG: YfhO family protein, partial [Candidatus Hydrogenedentes bacterium]|nr:YfhO family protein [Candidatus Hydrogenedentota bacterium]
MKDEPVRARSLLSFISETQGLRASVHPSSFVLLCSAVIFAILAYPLFLDRVYTFSDFGAYHLPLRAFYRECLQQGLNFTWMPSILCGYYVHAEGQAGMYHPLHYLLYRFLALEPAFAIECIIAYPVMFMGTAVFLRRWRLPGPACLFGAFLFTFSGFNLLHGMQINVLQVTAHIPWLLTLIDVAMRGESARSRRMASAGVALVSASQWLLGFPQAVYFSALAEGPYALMMATLLIGRGDAVRSVASRLVWLLAGKGVGMLIGAVQWIPTLDMLADSKRAGPSPGFSFSLSLEPRNLLQFIGPYFFAGGVYAGRIANPLAVEFGLYDGAVATVLAVWALSRLSSVKGAARSAESERDADSQSRISNLKSQISNLYLEMPRRILHASSSSFRPQAYILACAAFVFGAFALLMAFGEYTWVYPFVSKLPFLRAFRASTRHIVLVHLALAVLGAYAFAELSRQPARESHQGKSRGAFHLHRALTALVVAAWGITGLLACRFGPLWRTFAVGLAQPLAWLISPALITLAALLTGVASRGCRSALIALALFAAADQAVYGLHFLWPATPQTLSEYVGQFPPPPLVAGSRVFRPEANAYGLRNVDNCGGYIGVELRKRLTYDTAHLAALRLAGVRWATNIPARPHGDPKWFELRHVLPRVRLVSQSLQSHNVDLDIQSVDLAQTAFVTHPIELSGGAQGTVLRTVSSPGCYRIEAETSGRQLLVVSESYHEGWHATIDGKRHPVERVNGDFLGCVLESGVHAVELRFDPESL